MLVGAINLKNQCERVKFKVAPRVEKLRSSKKIEVLQVVLVLQVASWKNMFYHGGKKQHFFL